MSVTATVPSQTRWKKVASPWYTAIMLLLLVTGALLAVPAGILFLIFHSKKTVSHLIKDIKYKALFQAIGAQALYDDFSQRNNNKLGPLPDKKGQTAVITGGARGIGLEVVKCLCKTGMKVVMGVRNVDAGNKIAEQIKEENLPGSVEVYQLDTSSIKSVEKFAEEVAKDHPKIDLLVNNAGIMMAPYQLTEDGFESQWATNYLGHFLLTHLLMPNLVAAGDASASCARVVNVSSSAHYGGNLYFEDFNAKVEYVPEASYAQSKIAQIMFTRYIDRELATRNIKVKMYSTHPGVVRTDLFVHTNLHNTIFQKFWKSPRQGAVTILYACLSSLIENKGGMYLSNCREGISSPFSKDEAAQKRLFEESCKILNIENFGQLNLVAK